MQTEFIYPALADRSSPKEWEENGRPELLKKATARKEEILGQRSNAVFDAGLDARLRARFPVKLPVQ